MPRIHFDVLVPDASAAASVGDAFSRAVEILVQHGKLEEGQVLIDELPELAPGIEEQLRTVYEDERGEDPEGTQVARYVITATGASSMNQLAMGLSRVLTPKATLPQDPVALERQMDFELPAIYPWVVEVLR